MTDNTPEEDEYNYLDGYWRCGRADDCALAAGWGTDHNGVGACSRHGGAGGAPTGEDNGNYKHGAFSEHLRSDLTDDEEGALEDIASAFDDPEEARAIIADQAAEAWLKYKRSADTRFLREYRQLAETFNLAPNEDIKELRGEGGGPIGVESEVVTVVAEENDDE